MVIRSRARAILNVSIDMLKNILGKRVSLDCFLNVVHQGKVSGNSRDRVDMEKFWFQKDSLLLEQGFIPLLRLVFPLAREGIRFALLGPRPISNGKVKIREE